MNFTSFPDAQLFLKTTVTTGTLSWTALNGDNTLLDADNEVMHAGALPNFATEASTTGDQTAGTDYEVYTAGPAAVSATSFEFFREDGNAHQEAIRALRPRSIVEIGVLVTKPDASKYVDYVTAFYLGYDDSFPTGSDKTMCTVAIQPRTVKQTFRST